MSNKCVLVDPSFPASDLRPEIDWAECLLCQRRTGEKLVSLERSRRQDATAAYESLVNILCEFDKIGELPSHLMLARLDEGNGLVSTLQSHSASWHKTCRSHFCDRELKRRYQRVEKRAVSASTDNILQSDDESTDIKRICTRSEISSENPLRATTHVCFFCELPADLRHPLHEVSTLDMVDKRVKECALVLSDHRLLAKLATGDMVAIEAKYHASCLTQLYNRRRSLEREQYKQFSANRPECFESTAFAELTAYINDVRQVEGIIPVFKLADLKNMYVNRLQQLDAATVSQVNSTRLKEKLLAYFPDLSAHSDGRDVVLTFQSGLGAALSKACSSDTDEDAVHLARAAEIVRAAGLWCSDSCMSMLGPSRIMFIRVTKDCGTDFS